MSLITVVGSINLDLVASAPALPRAGQTVTDAVFARHPGGKGANQAVAARRMGADVRMIGCVGADSEADLATAILREEGVDLTGCRVVEHQHTGVALIAVGPDGENQIVVAPGANMALTADDVDLGDTDTVVCQLEVPLEAVGAAVERASFSILNCAPARQLPASLLEACDVVVVNETEWEFYGPLLSRVPLVVETLGAAGALAIRHDEEVLRVPTLEVEAVDAVGAGDAFVGTLAVELTHGEPLDDALRMATAAASVATTRRGAQASIPRRVEVLEALERMS
jgi:ribokinase